MRGGAGGREGARGCGRERFRSVQYKFRGPKMNMPVDGVPVPGGARGPKIYAVRRRPPPLQRASRLAGGAPGRMLGWAW